MTYSASIYIHKFLYANTFTNIGEKIGVSTKRVTGIRSDVIQNCLLFSKLLEIKKKEKSMFHIVYHQLTIYSNMIEFYQLHYRIACRHLINLRYKIILQKSLDNKII